VTGDRPLTRDEVRELDRIAIEEYGVPGIVLMENAGRACADAAREMLGSTEGARVVVVCGRGNNGGDGFVVARHLANWGCGVEVLLLGSVEGVMERGGEAAVNLSIVLRMGIAVTETRSGREAAQAIAARSGAGLVVDALLGTGLNGPVREPFLSAIRAMNRSSSPVLAVDIPSGLDADRGESLGAAVQADRTVTFAANKVGMARPAAARFLGALTVADISIPWCALSRLDETAGGGGQESPADGR
jgi:hydroxyethylthiazole kinase-like uncharacterized protein yjeF